MPDPRICCAAGICCDPPEARSATIDILTEAGVDSKDVEAVADWMKSNKIVLFDGTTAEAIKNMIDSHEAVE